MEAAYATHDAVTHLLAAFKDGTYYSMCGLKWYRPNFPIITLHWELTNCAECAVKGKPRPREH